MCRCAMGSVVDVCAASGCGKVPAGADGWGHIQGVFDRHFCWKKSSSILLCLENGKGNV